MTHQQAVKTLAAERYLLNEMAELERFDFEDHYFSCADCAEDVRAGALMRDGVKAGLVDSTVTHAASSPPRSRWQIVLPWAAAASLAVVAGYQSFVVLPRTGDRIEPQALTPISLRPATRGAVPTVVLGDSHVATLAVDLNVSDGASAVSYELSVGGRVVASGNAPAPGVGMPLLLMVPAATLRTPGEYTLAVRSVPSAASAGEYRFVVAEAVAPSSRSR